MNTLSRWEPTRELQTMRSLMDRFFDDPLFSPASLWNPRGENFPVPLDLVEEEGQYIVKASMPGVKPEEVEITLADNMLTIKGESKRESESNEGNYHVRERHSGTFMRQIALPMAVKAEEVEATHENGVLTLHLPKMEAVKPKKIAVKPMVESSKTENTTPQITNGKP